MPLLFCCVSISSRVAFRRRTLSLNLSTEHMAARAPTLVRARKPNWVVAIDFGEANPVLHAILLTQLVITRAFRDDILRLCCRVPRQ